MHIKYNVGFCYFVCATLPFMLASLGMSIYSVINIGEDDGLTIDVSGVGTCKDNTIEIKNATAWTQYPAKPFQYVVNQISEDFVGKNAIVWNEDTSIEVFKITKVDGMTVYSDSPLSVSQTCHFTIDDVNEIMEAFVAKMEEALNAAANRPPPSPSGSCKYMRDTASRDEAPLLVLMCSALHTRSQCQSQVQNCGWYPRDDT